MNTTRHYLLVSQALGFGLLGYGAYLWGNHTVASLTPPTSKSLPTVTTLAPAPQPEPEESRKRPMPWSPMGSLFAPALPGTPLPLAAAAKPTPPPAPLPMTTNVALPSPPDPLEDYVYSGFVTMNGIQSALIERKTTKQGWYVQAGDLWQDYRIGEVTAQGMNVLIAGKKRWLPKSNFINLVPLTADAGKGGLPSGTSALAQTGQGATPQNDGTTSLAQAFSAAAASRVNEGLMEAVLGQLESSNLSIRLDDTSKLSTSFSISVENLNLSPPVKAPAGN